MADSLESTWKDPYEGEHPRRIYSYVPGLSSTVVGFDSISGVISDWETYYRPSLDEKNIGSVLRGENVIEFRCGESTKFLDYAVENHAATYTGVDLFRLPIVLPPANIGATKVNYEFGDMAQFLATQRPDSAVLVECSVLGDEHIRSGRADVKKRIMKVVAEAIFRVAKPGKPLLSFTFQYSDIRYIQPEYLEALLNAGFVVRNGDFLYKPESK